MTDATHHCEDCGADLGLLWDDRDDESTPPACGECGGTNVHRVATDGSTDETPHEDEWEFSEGDIIREKYAKSAPGGVDHGKSEYRIKWLLFRPANGKRCYHVQKEEGGTHLYTASTVEGRYEVIPPEESGAFDAADDEESGGVEW